MLPIHAGIQFLNVGLGRMIAFGDKFEQRCVRQEFFSRLLGVTRWQIAYIGKIVALNRIGGERDRNLIEHPLVDETGLTSGVGVLVRDERLAKELAHFSVDLART